MKILIILPFCLFKKIRARERRDIYAFGFFPMKSINILVYISSKKDGWQVWIISIDTKRNQSIKQWFDIAINSNLVILTATLYTHRFLSTQLTCTTLSWFTHAHSPRSTTTKRIPGTVQPSYSTYSTDPTSPSRDMT